MTGNHPGRSGNPARRANPGLDQIAAQIRNDRKAGHPELVPLFGVEEHLLNVFREHAGDRVEPVQAGATMLVMGQLFNQVVSQLPEEEFFRAPGLMVNVLRLMGQRLYSGDLPSTGLRCPFPLASGKPCPFQPSHTMGGTLTAVMRGHVALHHPGETWPPPDDDVDALPDAELLDEDQAAADEAYANAAHCSTCDTVVNLEDEAPLNPAVITTEGVQCIPCARDRKRRGDDEPYTENHAANFPAEIVEREQQFIQQLSATVNDEPPAGETPILDQLRAEYRNRPAPTPIAPQPTPAVLGQCPTCERHVPLERPSVVASHCVENTHLECPGTGREPVEYTAGEPFDAQQWTPPAGYTDAGMSDLVELRREPDGSLTEVITPADPAHCPHRKHDRVRRLGAERCIACGTEIKPDAEADGDAAGA